MAINQLEIKDMNFKLKGDYLGRIDLDENSWIECYAIFEVRTMQLYAAAYNNGKKLYDGELQDFRMPVSSIRIYRKFANVKEFEIREFLTSVTKDDTPKKAFRALSEMKQDLNDDLRNVPIVLHEVNLPYIKNAYGNARTYVRSYIKNYKKEYSQLIHGEGFGVQLTGRSYLLKSILEAAAATEK
jgi:hypothetical protein